MNVGKIVNYSRVSAGNRAQDETTEFDETVASEGLPTANDQYARSELELDFLAPAEEADEIGRLGGYRVLEVIGAGGMGIVFRAEDPQLKRQVALKTLKPAIAASRGAKARFLREAEATAAIEHDHIVTIFQVGEDRGIPFFAMRFLQGESLEDRLNLDQRLDQRLAVRIGCQIALGLAAAHERGLIHRDIKPDNIWLDKKQGRVKIVDFGLARSISEHQGLTISGMVLGTPKYMSPEQAQGETVDHRCDLFSLGSVLYHLVTGHPPFAGGNLTATLLAVTNQDPEPIEAACPTVEPELADLIGRLMAKDPVQRPQSALEVASALQQIDQKLAHLPGGTSSSFLLNVGAASQSLDTMLPDLTATRGESISLETSARVTKPRKPLLWGVAAAAALVLTVLVLWASEIIFTIKTEHGTLTVTVDGDDFATTVQGRKITVRNTKTGETHTIALDQPEEQQSLIAGSYIVINTDSEMATTPKSFTIQHDKQSFVNVEWQPAHGATPTRETDLMPLESELQELLSSAILVYNFEQGTYASGRAGELSVTLQDLGPGEMRGIFEGFVEFDESIAGQAYVCDGVGRAVRIPDLEPLMSEENGTVTVSFWHRTDKAKLGMMFDCGVHTLGGFDIVSLPDRRYQVNFEGNHLYSPEPYELGQWRHVVVVFDRPNISLYVNAEQVGSWKLNPPENDLVWDSWGRLGGQVKAIKQDERYFQGRIDEFVILPQAASVSDINLLYRWTKAGHVLPTIHTEPR